MRVYRLQVQCMLWLQDTGLCISTAYFRQLLTMTFAAQGEELVIDESQAAIEPLPNRDRAPLPDPPITPGNWHGQVYVSDKVSTHTAFKTNPHALRTAIAI